MENFDNNAIYKYLREKNSFIFVNMIEQTYNFCDNLLKMLPKDFSNYTFHDIGHSIRVVGHMTDLIKDRIQEYSDLHLALIVITGLMHDTGMFCSYDERNELKRQIIDDISQISDEDANFKIQEYIREHHAERVSKVLESYKCNNGQNVGSLFVVGNSYNVSDYISQICQSHTESIGWIRSNISVDEQIAVYDFNPQQIAILLRIADNLDIDDRRAPYYIAELLGVKGYSDDEWRKHIPITNYDKVKTSDEGLKLFFRGECKDSSIYRKILEHIDWLETELKAIEDDIKTYKEPYNINIVPDIENSIKTIGFEASSLKFTLDYEKVVHLLMGEKIYGNQRAGLRELLQNSIDAVLVMKEKLKGELISSYSPIISIHMNKTMNSIVIEDNGIGMTESVIKNYFFNIGKSFYVSEEYRKYRLDYSAIGHFGIGFLACFMLSNHVQLETKSIDGEAISIEFEKNSPYITKKKGIKGTFSEGHGTKIYLDYSEIIGGIFENEEELIEYVKELLLIKDYSLFIFSCGNEVEHILQNSSCEADIDLVNKDVGVKCSVTKYPIVLSECKDIVRRDKSHVYIYYIDMMGEEAFISLALLEGVLSDYDFTDLAESDIRQFLADDAGIYIVDSLDALGVDLSEVHEDFLGEVTNKALNRCYLDGRLIYTIVPYISNAAIFREFLAVMDAKGYDSAFKLYKSNLHYIYIPGDKVPSPKILAEMVNEAVDLDEGDMFYEEDEYSHYFSFKPISHYQRVRSINNENAFLSIIKGDSITKLFPKCQAKVYMKGILVSEEPIFLPYLLRGTILSELIINVNSDEYELNVSRNEFNSNSHSRLMKEIVKEIYYDMANTADSILSEDEKEAIVMFAENDLDMLQF